MPIEAFENLPLTKPLPKGIEIVYCDGDDAPCGGGDPTIAALDDHGQVVGWPSPFLGKVFEVCVASSLRWRGIATAMWVAAKQRWPRLRHADKRDQTSDGLAWVAALGGN